MDKETFGEAFMARADALWRVARAILRREEDCRDALQETALRAWSSRASLRDEALFGTWITRILINVCRSELRRQRRFPLSSAAQEPMDDGTAPSPVLSALDVLPRSLRLPAVLHYVDGYSVEETAAILRVPPSTVRGRLSRARRALRLELNEEVDAHDAR